MNDKFTGRMPLVLIFLRREKKIDIGSGYYEGRVGGRCRESRGKRREVSSLGWGQSLRHARDLGWGRLPGVNVGDLSLTLGDMRPEEATSCSQ